LALTRINKVGDGVTSTFNVNFTLGYISESHVTAWVDGEVDGLGDIVYRTITFTTADMLTLSGDPPGNGVEVYFERTVPKDSLLVDFSNGDNLDETNLDTMQLQILHIAMEAIDGRIGPIASNFDMNGYKIVNHGEPVDDNDLATRAFVLSSSDSGGAGGAAGAIAGAQAAAAAIAIFVATAANIGTGAVTTTKIADANVTAAKLATGAVGNDAIADNVVNARTIMLSDIAAIVTKLGIDDRLTKVGTIIDSVDLNVPAGYLKVNGFTISNGAGGGTARANDDTLALYTMLWAYDNTVLPIQTSTGTLSSRGVSAASDFAAGKRMPLHDIRGYHKRAWDDGRGVDTGRVVGSAQADALLTHLHTGVLTIANDSPDHAHSTNQNAYRGANGSGNRGWSSGDSHDGSANLWSGGASVRHGHPGSTIAIANNVGGASENRVKTLAFPCYIKY
jgi:hypothetical protein